MRPTCITRGTATIFDYAVVSCHWSSAPTAQLHEAWTSSPHTAVPFDSTAKQLPIGIEVFRRPRDFPSAKPFGPWLADDGVRSIPDLDLAVDLPVDDVGPTVLKCYGHIEDELAMRFAIDKVVEPSYVGMGGFFRKAEVPLLANSRGAVAG